MVSRASILLIRLEILVSTSMDDFIEWRPFFEEMGFVFLDFSEDVTIGGFFRLDFQINLTLGFYPFARMPLDTWFLRRFCFDSLNRHREFGIVTTSLCHDEDTG